MMIYPTYRLRDVEKESVINFTKGVEPANFCLRSRNPNLQKKIWILSP